MSELTWIRESLFFLANLWLSKGKFWTLGEGEGGMIWENDTEACALPYVK